MIEDTLMKILHEKANKVGLEFKDVEITPLGHNYWPFIDFNDVVVSQMINGKILLSVRNINEFTDESLKEPERLKRLERIMEHGVCKLKDSQEGIYHLEALPRKSMEMMYNLTLATYYAYIDYFASKRQIKEFGQDNFSLYQLEDLGPFFRKTDNNIKANNDSYKKTVYIFSLFKEQLKCNMMCVDQIILPNVLSKITSPFEDSFEKINESGLQWDKKVSLFYFMADTISLNLDIFSSYSQNKLILNKDKNIWHKPSEIVDSKVYPLAHRLECFIESRYSNINNPLPTFHRQ